MDWNRYAHTFLNGQPIGPTFQSWPLGVCEQGCGYHGFVVSLILVLKGKKQLIKYFKTYSNHCLSSKIYLGKL